MTTPRKGDFIVVKTGGWAARLIQFGTRSRWNHAAIIVDDQRHIVEAEPSGCAYGDLSKYDRWNYVKSDIALNAWQREKIADYAIKRVGAKYGWLDIVALALVSFGIRPKWLDNYAARDDRLVCSQLVSYAYTYAGHRLADPEWNCTPGDLADVITEEGQ